MSFRLQIIGRMPRVSSKTVYTFIFLISRPPRSLEILSWTFFNSSFRVDSKNIHVLCLAGWPVSSLLLGYLVDGLTAKTGHLVVMVWNSDGLLYSERVIYTRIVFLF